MARKFYVVTRDLHLYLGLFCAPFVLVFSISAFFLVHSWIPGVKKTPGVTRAIAGVALPDNLESLNGRARVDALRTVLPAMGVQGEIGFVRHVPKDRLLVFSVNLPGRETTIELNMATHAAAITPRDLGVWEGLVDLHKSPGQHLVDIRMNWFPMLVWRWFADSTVYLVFFISVSGVYLWAVLRAERGPGLTLLAAGVLSLIGLVYAVIH